MPVLQCPIDSCTYETADVLAVAAAALINLHAVVHQSPSPAATPPQQPRGPKLERPRIKLNASVKNGMPSYGDGTPSASNLELLMHPLLGNYWNAHEKTLETSRYGPTPHSPTFQLLMQQRF